MVIEGIRKIFQNTAFANQPRELNLVENLQPGQTQLDLMLSPQDLKRLEQLMAISDETAGVVTGRSLHHFEQATRPGNSLFIRKRPRWCDRLFNFPGPLLKARF